MTVTTTVPVTLKVIGKHSGWPQPDSPSALADLLGDRVNDIAGFVAEVHCTGGPTSLVPDDTRDLTTALEELRMLLYAVDGDDPQERATWSSGAHGSVSWTAGVVTAVAVYLQVTR